MEMFKESKLHYHPRKKGGISIEEAIKAIETLYVFDPAEFTGEQLRTNFGAGFFMVADIGSQPIGKLPEIQEKLKHTECEAQKENPNMVCSTVLAYADDMTTPTLAPIALKVVQSRIEALQKMGYTEHMNLVMSDLGLLKD